MELNNLKPALGAVKKTKRIGRGQGSGHGGTSTRGHKGAKSRSGYKSKIGFEGGQMPLQRRLPKFGFTNPNRVEYAGVNLDVIQQLLDDGRVTNIISKNDLVLAGLLSKSEKLKILGRGELKSSITISANKFSKTAQLAIEKVGGSVTLI